MNIGNVFVIDIFSQVNLIVLKLSRARLFQIKSVKPSCEKIYVSSDRIDIYYFTREIFNWNTFRVALLHFLKKKNSALIINSHPPKREPIDYKGNGIFSFMLLERIEAEQLMSWLSTLGGGFSALGESILSCAEIARKISLKQLAIGMKIGDPFLQSRCKLFYSISLIQTGKLRLAKRLILRQYLFAIKHAEVDARLVKMCQGIWLKLQYEHQKRRSRSINAIQQTVIG